MIFKNQKTGKVEQISATDMEMVNYQKFIGTWGLRIFLKNGTLHRFRGFKEGVSNDINLVNNLVNLVNNINFFLFNILYILYILYNIIIYLFKTKTKLIFRIKKKLQNSLLKTIKKIC